jgi:hypothetical protein
VDELTASRRRRPHGESNCGNQDQALMGWWIGAVANEKAYVTNAGGREIDSCFRRCSTAVATWVRCCKVKKRLEFGIWPIRINPKGE